MSEDELDIEGSGVEDTHSDTGGSSDVGVMYTMSSDGEASAPSHGLTHGDEEVDLEETGDSAPGHGLAHGDEEPTGVAEVDLQDSDEEDLSAPGHGDNEDEGEVSAQGHGEGEVSAQGHGEIWDTESHPGQSGFPADTGGSSTPIWPNSNITGVMQSLALMLPTSSASESADDATSTLSSLGSAAPADSTVLNRMSQCGRCGRGG